MISPVERNRVVSAKVIELESARIRLRTPSDQRLIVLYGKGMQFADKLFRTLNSEPHLEYRYPGNPPLCIRCETWEDHLELQAFSMKRIGGGKVVVTPQSHDRQWRLEFVHWPHEGVDAWYFLPEYQAAAAPLSLLR